MKKNVLVLASTFPRWENDTTPPFVLELEKRLTKDFTIIVLAPHYPGAKKHEALDGVEVYRFQYFWPASLQKLCYDGGIMPNIKKNKLLIFQAIPFLLCELFAVLKLIRKEKISFIHAHWIIPQGIIAVAIKMLSGVPYLVTTHGGDIYGLQSGPLQAIKKTVFKKASHITVVSNDIKEKIKNIAANLPISVISMGVDSSLFNPDKKDESLKKKNTINGSLLLFVGRLAEKKGVIYLIQAMQKITQKLPSTYLFIIGEGTQRNSLEKLTDDLQLSKNIVFLGPINNSLLPTYYATADIFIGPSIMTKDGDTEGLGLTFVEASLSGCIPIGTNVGGISDVIEDGKTGFLVPQKNADAIADKVIALLSNKEKMNRIKKEGIQITKEVFDWSVVSQKYAQIYQRI